MYSLLFLNLIVPCVMLLVGSLLRKHPVKDMSSQNGYSTRSARRSQAHWNYAQSIAPEIFLRTGKQALLREVLLSILCLLLRIRPAISLAIGTAVGFFFLYQAFQLTEKAIHEKFPD